MMQELFAVADEKARNEIKFDFVKNEILKNKKTIYHKKKHGEWAVLFLYPGLYLCMDTWNRAITLRDGLGKINYWVGSEDKHLAWLGIEFPDIRVVEPVMLLWVYIHLKIR